MAHELVPCRLEEAFILLVSGRGFGPGWGARSSQYLWTNARIQATDDSPVLSNVHDPTGSLIIHLIGKYLEDRPLVGRERFRHGNLELDLQVTGRIEAARTTTELLHSHTRQGDPVAGAGASGNLDLDFTVQGRHGNLTTQKRRGQGDRGCVEDIGSRAAEPMIRRDANRHVEIASLSARARGSGCARRRGISFTCDPQPHTILHTARDIDLNGLLVSDYTVAVACSTLRPTGNNETGTATGITSSGHLETTLHEVDTGSGPIALTALCTLGALLQTVTLASTTLRQRSDDNILRRALCSFHEGDVGLDFDILSDKYLLERTTPSAASPTSTACECAKKIFKVDIGAESTPKSTSETSAKSVETTSTGERVATRGARVESAVLIEGGGAKPVVVLSLLGVRQ